MGHQAKCYTCQSMNLPMYILNREKEVIKFNTQTRNRHSCAMCMGKKKLLIKTNKLNYLGFFMNERLMLSSTKKCSIKGLNNANNC
jgi:hypothetical protein